jgi:hypothetical protein
MTKLPTDLLTDSAWLIGGGQTRCRGGISGGAQGVRAHVWDGCGLSRCPGGGHCCGSAHPTSGRTIDKTEADPLCDAKLASSEGPRPGDRVTGAAIAGSFCLK